jgi:hypothetical protein
MQEAVNHPGTGEALTALICTIAAAVIRFIEKRRDKKKNN